jgi:hypothetical protein
MGSSPYPCLQGVKPCGKAAERDLVTARALALLAAFASPVFMVAAIAGWLYEVWPATPLTLGLAAIAVVGGPVLAIVHVATADEEREHEEEVAPRFVARPAPPQPVLLTPQAARAKAFHNWRDSVHPAIERRERERRASQWIKH